MPRIPLNDQLLIKLDKASKVSEGGLHIPSTEGKRTDSVALLGVIVSLPQDHYLVDGAIKYVDSQGREKRIRLKVGDVIEVGKFEITHSQEPGHAYVALEQVLGRVSA